MINNIRSVIIWVWLLCLLLAAPLGLAAEEEEALSSDDLAALIAEGSKDTLLIDVRTPGEYRSGAIPTAINIPHHEIGNRIADVMARELESQDKSARIILYCRSGARSTVAKGTLESLGYQKVINFGSVADWDGELVIRE